MNRTFAKLAVSPLLHTFVELFCVLQTCYDNTHLTVAPMAAPYLKQLGDQLAPSASFNFTLQVS